MIERLKILNPKRNGNALNGRESWYPYYAGFSSQFAEALLASADLPASASVLDPWNGSGTTTEAAARLGLNASGYDLNPVMVVVAKARLLANEELPALQALAERIIETAKEGTVNCERDAEPLCTWFSSRATGAILSLEKAIQTLLVDAGQNRKPGKVRNVDEFSCLAAFFYTALFRTVRFFLRRFIPSNPTWIKKPKTGRSRLRPHLDTILNEFQMQIREMSETVTDALAAEFVNGPVDIRPASSESIPIQDASVDFALSSPPYCTRIDYAVATMSELAILGYGPNNAFRTLRKSLAGSATVPDTVPQLSDIPTEWGLTCQDFLRRVASHPSKASKSYYYKNLFQYFAAINKSITELSRCMKINGCCVIVVQDSYYKDIHNDLPQIFVEIAQAHGLILARRRDFYLQRIMSKVNPSIRKYRSDFAALESVLCFIKQ